MTPDQAIQAHREWKFRFLAAMGKQERMNVAEVSADTCCKFGAWLHAEAKDRFDGLPAYRDCVEAHAAFHVLAGKIAQMVNDGQVREASQLLAYGTPYARASETLTVKVVAMFKESGQA